MLIMFVLGIDLYKVLIVKKKSTAVSGSRKCCVRWEFFRSIRQDDLFIVMLLL